MAQCLTDILFKFHGHVIQMLFDFLETVNSVNVSFNEQSQSYAFFSCVVFYGQLISW